VCLGPRGIGVDASSLPQRHLSKFSWLVQSKQKPAISVPRISGPRGLPRCGWQDSLPYGIRIYYGFGQFGGLQRSHLEPYRSEVHSHTGSGNRTRLSHYSRSWHFHRAAQSTGAPINRRDQPSTMDTLHHNRRSRRKRHSGRLFRNQRYPMLSSDTTLNGINPCNRENDPCRVLTIDYRGTFNHASTNAFQTACNEMFPEDSCFRPIMNGLIHRQCASEVVKQTAQNVACRAANDPKRPGHAPLTLEPAPIWQFPLEEGRRIFQHRHPVLRIYSWWLAVERHGPPEAGSLSMSHSAAAPAHCPTN